MIGALAMLLATGCGPSGPTMSEGDAAILDAPLDQLALVLASDHITGAYAVVDLQAHAAVTRIEVTHGDARLRVVGGRAFVINRLQADNLQIVDPLARFGTSAQWSVGPGGNPVDVAVTADGRGFVPLYERAEVAIHDLESGERLGAVDLSAWADDDGLPEPAGAVVAPDGRVLAPLQRLARTRGFVPEPPSRLAVIDPDAAVVVEAPALRLRNPVEPVSMLADGRLAVVAMGAYAEIDEGGVELVDASPPYASEVVAREEDFGGSLTHLATLDGDTLFVVAHLPGADAATQMFDRDTVVFRFVVSTGERREVLATDGPQVGEIALTPEGRLLVCDRTPRAPGLRIFDASTLTELTEAPIDTGLPPLSVAPLSGHAFQP